MIFVQDAYANCPVCIITVSGGLFLAKQLGIDDFLVSIWISGLNTAVAFFIASKIKDKRANKPFIWTFFFYLLTIFYLFYTKQIGHPQNQLLGIDKVFFGLTTGLLIFFAANWFDGKLRAIHGGKVFFHYQKVIIPLVFLAFSTLVMKFLFGL
jgi:hypothetical protein